MKPADPNRRELLQRLARWIILPVGVAGLAHMANRERETCTGDSICSRCGRNQGCILPQAVSYREVTQERKHG